MLVKIVNYLLRPCMILQAACSFSTNSCNAVVDALLAFSCVNASYSFKTLSWLSAAVLKSKASLMRGYTELTNSVSFLLQDSISYWSSLLCFTLSIFCIGGNVLIYSFTASSSVCHCLMVSCHFSTFGLSCKFSQASTLSSSSFDAILTRSEIFIAEA